MNSSLTFENFQAKFYDPLVFCSTASSCILNISDSEMLAIELDLSIYSWVRLINLQLS